MKLCSNVNAVHLQQKELFSAFFKTCIQFSIHVLYLLEYNHTGVFMFLIAYQKHGKWSINKHWSAPNNVFCLIFQFNLNSTWEKKKSTKTSVVVYQFYNVNLLAWTATDTRRNRKYSCEHLLKLYFKTGQQKQFISSVFPLIKEDNKKTNG